MLYTSDSVPHERLLIKLDSYRIRGKILEWITDFLRDRSQKVRIGNKFLSKTKVWSGIPQGSILGPTLFDDGSVLADEDCGEGWWSILACSLVAVETDS